MQENKEKSIYWSVWCYFFSVEDKVVIFREFSGQVQFNFQQPGGVKQQNKTKTSFKSPKAIK